jgi:hypothetical protein
MKLFFVTTMAGLLLGTSASYGSDTLQDIPKDYPVAFRAYQRTLPAKFRKFDWIYRLNAVTHKVDDKLDIGGRRYIFGKGCQPHDCADNQLALVVAQNGGKAAVKIVSAGATGGQPQYFGTNDPKLRSILDTELGR